MTIIWIIFSALAVWIVSSFFRPINRFEDDIDSWRAISHRYNTNTQTDSSTPSYWPPMFPTPQQHYDFIREMYERENQMIENEGRNQRGTLVYFVIAIVIMYCLVKWGVL